MPSLWNAPDHAAELQAHGTSVRENMICRALDEIYRLGATELATRNVEAQTELLPRWFKPLRDTANADENLWWVDTVLNQLVRRVKSPAVLCILKAWLGQKGKLTGLTVEARAPVTLDAAADQKDALRNYLQQTPGEAAAIESDRAIGLALALANAWLNGCIKLFLDRQKANIVVNAQTGQRTLGGRAGATFQRVELARAAAMVSPSIWVFRLASMKLHHRTKFRIVWGW
jgi:hypothetical protein